MGDEIRLKVDDVTYEDEDIEDVEEFEFDGYKCDICQQLFSDTLGIHGKIYHFIVKKNVDSDSYTYMHVNLSS